MTRKIVCLCGTYNVFPKNVHLLADAVESFMRQDYPNKELLILDDTPRQTLVNYHKDVRVINVSVPFNSLGEKLNYAVEHSGTQPGDFLCRWDYDDIRLPWELSQLADRIGSRPYYNPHCYWWLNGTDLRFDHAFQIGHAGSIFTRQAFEDAGRYPPLRTGEDAHLDRQLSKLVGLAKEPPRILIDRWGYIYRWGDGSTHVSVPSGWEQIHAQPIEEGEFVVPAKWSRDWVTYTRERMPAGISEMLTEAYKPYRERFLPTAKTSYLPR